VNGELPPGNAQAPFCHYFVVFHDEMIKLFDRSARGDEAASRLVRLLQEDHSVTDFAIQFKTLASCDWNEGGPSFQVS